ncbi:MAG: chemotaxis protein CheX [Planctomycetaceae bacterium]|nr:chemotaxis protein CheX [Planctomycetaceae bacterium]
MQAEHINPFLRSLANTFTMMFDCEVRRGPLGVTTGGSRKYPISGVIGLSGRAVGTVVINLSEEVALKAASALMLTELTEVDDDVIDAVGELANIVAGAAKAELEEFELSVSLPNVVIGKGHEIRFPTNAKPICVPYDTDFGPLLLEVGLEAVAAPAGA